MGRGRGNNKWVWDCEMSGETVSVLFAPFCVRQMVFRRALQMIVMLYSVVFTLRCTGGISLLENLITQHKHMHEMQKTRVRRYALDCKLWWPGF